MPERKKIVFKIKVPTFNRKKIIRGLLLSLLLLVALALGGMFGAYLAIRENLPDVGELEQIKPKIISVVYSDDGQPAKEFAAERRIQIPYEKIPETLKQAIIATEDPRFFAHKGIDYRGIMRALKEDFFRIILGKTRLHGGSTITQQLARSLFLYPQQTIRRKLKEMFVAMEIERRYTKEKILELYCNQFYLGHGTWGVESAAQLYFGKSATELTLPEAALIAGIFRGPAIYSPYNNPKVTLNRRNHVLNRLAEEGFISRQQAEEFKKQPLEVLPLRRQTVEAGSYFYEEVRKYIERKYGDDVLYRGGLKIYTTLNLNYQKYAEEALDRGLRAQDKKNGWRKDKRNLLAEGKSDLEKIWLDDWDSLAPIPGKTEQAIVLEAGRTEAKVRLKNYTGLMTSKGIEWTKARYLNDLIKPGDVILVEVQSVDEATRTARVNLDQEPAVEGAFIAVDVATGQIKAMVGGYSFKRSQFNRATQALRQTGSAIKPIFYTAALEKGFTPASVIVDEPTNFVDKWTGNPWTPKNYDGEYHGAVTLRTGLEESRNVITAKLLDYISPQVGVEYCRKFGITSTIYPYLSLALGAFEVTLQELVSAFSVFPNKGLRARPYFIIKIEDKDGNILEENLPQTEEVLSPQIAYMMTYLLQGVVQRGTAASAASLNWPLGGKTGTTNKFTDAWFIGFSPSLCAGAWVGYDTKITLGNKQSGAVVALPIWRDFFARVIEDKKKEFLATQPATSSGEEAQTVTNPEAILIEDFEVPPNLVFVTIDRKTGLLASPVCKYPFQEVFLPGTEPNRYCSLQDHLRVLDYYAERKAREERE
ncbi:MAG: Multimodular transpeptidase-transglycosylase [Candidatus Saccharicenans subterraneus]|uniref:Penicillin-binding protein 1A n=1 Tax=Candidatus Saccharicenans subterraneus TaxID=2508984 RepID=A0A3E2BKQ1_9BACT|nr:MAG: Multimodular transpeptidase-transglycosylase [Candidatus Saccharicenans subterraneum]